MFPYCGTCSAHIGQWERAYSVLALGPIGFAIGIALALTGGGVVAFLVSSGIGSVLAVVIFVHARRQVRAILSKNCASPGAAVTHLGWSGSVSSFEFASDRYGASFAADNVRKLVNVSRWLQKLLDSRPEEIRLKVEAVSPQQPALSSPQISAATAPLRPDPEERVNKPRPVADAVLDWISRIESYKGPEARRNALIRALQEISDPVAQQQLRLAASRIETAAVLEKVDGLSTTAAKRRHLEKAIAALRSDDIPDELQADGIRELEARLRELG